MKVAIIAIAIIILGSLDALFLLAIDGRRDVPILHKIANVMHVVFILIILAIIIKFNLWC